MLKVIQQNETRQYLSFIAFYDIILAGCLGCPGDVLSIAKWPCWLLNELEIEKQLKLMLLKIFQCLFDISVH